MMGYVRSPLPRTLLATRWSLQVEYPPMSRVIMVSKPLQTFFEMVRTHCDWYCDGTVTMIGLAGISAQG